MLPNRAIQASELDAELAAKLDEARAIIGRAGPSIVAFSGGVDSALVLRIAVEALGSARVLAVTGRSPSVPAAELASVAVLAGEIGAPHEFCDTGEFDDPNYTSNPTNRCYFCKSELYDLLLELARARGFAAVLCGTNADDLGDYRPGIQAAFERRIVAPLVEANITKADVRALLAAYGLAIHDKPASPCLSSRVPYGEAVTPEKLRRIDAAETLLRELGFRECRVRHHEKLARIEVPAGEIARFADVALRQRVDAAFRELGFQYVALDLKGLRSGSLNEVLLGPGLRAE